MILESQDDLEVVREVDKGVHAVQQCRALAPDVVLMDVRLPTMNGVEVTAELARQGLRTRVLILTTFGSGDYVYEAVRAGASGFLLKDVAPADMVHAVRVVAAGQALVGARAGQARPARPRTGGGLRLRARRHRAGLR